MSHACATARVGRNVGLAFAMLLATLPLLASSLVLPSSPRCRPARMAIDLPAPPANPPTTCSDGGGDGDSLQIRRWHGQRREDCTILSKPYIVDAA